MENENVTEPIENNKTEEGETEEDVIIPVTSLFQDKEYKEKVESKLEPFSIEELLLENRLTQKIPLTKDLSVTFMTLSAGEDAVIDKIVREYLNNGYHYGKIITMLQLATSIKSLNGAALIDETPIVYSESSEEAYIKQVRKKLEKIFSLNVQFIGLLVTHFFWFENRASTYIKDQIINDLENF